MIYIDIVALYFFKLQWFRVLGALFSRFGCFVFEFWVLRFRDLGASCFGLCVRELSFSKLLVAKPKRIEDKLNIDAGMHAKKELCF